MSFSKRTQRTVEFGGLLRVILTNPLVRPKLPTHPGRTGFLEAENTPSLLKAGFRWGTQPVGKQEGSGGGTWSLLSLPPMLDGGSSCLGSTTTGSTVGALSQPLASQPGELHAVSATTRSSPLTACPHYHAEAADMQGNAGPQQRPEEFGSTCWSAALPPPPPRVRAVVPKSGMSQLNQDS